LPLSLCSILHLTNEKQCGVDLFLQPFSADALSNLFGAFNQLLGNNYPAASLAVGGVQMASGHEQVISAYGSCPVIIFSGDTKLGKTTSVTGSLDLRFHYFFITSKNAQLFIILLLIFLRLEIFWFDFASLCIA